MNTSTHIAQLKSICPTDENCPIAEFIKRIIVYTNEIETGRTPIHEFKVLLVDLSILEDSLVSKKDKRLIKQVHKILVSLIKTVQKPLA